ncbi:MAG: hypothetical protein LM580_09625 [Thermofilum sp.]|nr:hypothetical protein [Thermofilum sp.]
MADAYSLVKAALLRAERARVLREVKAEPVLYVTEIASGGRGGGSGAEAGRELHRQLWGLDPYEIAFAERWAGPLPLAWRFRFGWVYGVCDLAVFERGKLRRVVEVKSYGKVKRAERAQAALYGLLAELNFLARPEVLVETPEGAERVEGWELLALDSLSRKMF